MTDLHRLVAELALALAALGAAWSVVAVIARRAPGRLYVANLIWAAIAVLATAGLGAILLGTGPGPRDGLHVVYGVLAAAALPIAAGLAAGRTESQRRGIGFVASIVLMILVLRLFQTAG